MYTEITQVEQSLFLSDDIWVMTRLKGSLKIGLLLGCKDDNVRSNVCVNRSLYIVAAFAGGFFYGRDELLANVTYLCACKCNLATFKGLQCSL